MPWFIIILILILSNVGTGYLLFRGDASSDDIRSGKTAIVNGSMKTGSMPIEKISDSTSTIYEGYYKETKLEKIDSDLNSDNIRNGVTIFGISGNANIIDSSSGNVDANADDLRIGKKAWVSGQLIVGTGKAFERYIDNGDGTITDNRIGLTWLKTANCFDAQNWKAALQFTQKLQNGDCGLTDKSQSGEWRLPTKYEWQIMSNQLYKNSTHSNWRDQFTDIQSTKYWVSSPFTLNETNGLAVATNNGLVSVKNKSTKQYILPVRRSH
jgi:hypothetical protein